MRKVVAYELPALDGVAEQPTDFVTVVREIRFGNAGPEVVPSTVPPWHW